MNRFQIPEIYRPGFEALSKLSEENFLKLLKSLQEIPVGYSGKNFVSRVESLKIDGIESISKTIYSLGNLFYSQNSEIGILANELALSYKETKGDLPESFVNDIRDKLTRIFTDCRNLILTFKAINLLSDNDILYDDSKIITDIRLIFNETIEQTDRNAVIIHRMKIQFEKNGIDENIYFTLDRNDLTELKKQIDRAIEKERIIREDYKNIKFADIIL